MSFDDTAGKLAQLKTDGAFSKGGAFAENIRTITGDDAADSELRESMKAHGWVEELPALVDESGTILVGHRRLKIATELGITPVAKTLHIGVGDEADAKRLRLAIVSNIGHKPLSKEDRQRIAEFLYGSREWTQQRIAEALNVDQAQISRDLSNLCTPHNSKPTKTATNPRGAGRPKSRPKSPEEEKLAQDIGQLHAQGETYQEIADKLGVKKDKVSNTLKNEAQQRKGIESVAGQVDLATFSLTAQQKLAVAIRKEQDRLRAEFATAVESRVKDEVKQTLESLREGWQRQLDLSKSIIENRNGFLTKKVWNLIVKCLHPDTGFDQIVALASAGKSEELPRLKERYSDAFRMFKSFEKFCLNEKESPTTFAPPLPKTAAEWAAAKAKATAARKAARAAKKNGMAISK